MVRRPAERPRVRRALLLLGRPIAEVGLEAATRASWSSTGISPFARRCAEVEDRAARLVDRLRAPYIRSGR